MAGEKKMKYGGKVYWLWRVKDTKDQALKSAKGARLRGWNARVVKVKNGWGVFARTNPQGGRGDYRHDKGK